MKQITTLAPIAVALLLLAGCDDSLAPPAVTDQRMNAVAPGQQLAAPSNANAVLSSDSTIDIVWQDNTSNETRFEVYRSSNGPSVEFSLLTSTAANATAYSDGGLSASTNYCYRIRAVRVRGNHELGSTFSNSACAETPTPPPPPLPVPNPAFGTTVTPSSSTNVLVHWITSGWPVEGFRIQRSSDGGTVWTLAATFGPANLYLFDTGLQSEQMVCYRVIAFNTSGDAAPSNTACATPPAAPTALNVTAVDAETLELTWIDNSGVEQGYEVLLHWQQMSCCPDGGGCDAGWWEGESLLGELPANATTYRTAGVLGQDVCGYSSWLEVRATKDGGHSTGALYLLDPWDWSL